MTESAATEAAIARIEANLVAIKNQIDYSERAASQLVRLMEERFVGQFGEVNRRIDSIEKRLDSMDQARKDEHRESNEQRGHIEDRIGRLENFNARLIGMAFGVSVISGGTAAAIARVLAG